MYAKLCQEIKERGYLGLKTEYTQTNVDNEKAEISVDFDLLKFVNSVHVEGDKIVINQ